MWSATSRAGMVGCIRDLVMNGRSVQLAEVARTQDLGQYLPASTEKIFFHQFLLGIRSLKGIQPSNIVNVISFFSPPPSLALTWSCVRFRGVRLSEPG